MSKKEQATRLYQTIEQLALQAGEDADETIDWLCGEHGGMARLFLKYFSPSTNAAQPAEWKGLTNEEIYGEGGKHEKFAKNGNEWFDRGSFARAIEAKLKEKNT